MEQLGFALAAQRLYFFEFLMNGSLSVWSRVSQAEGFGSGGQLLIYKGLLKRPTSVEKYWRGNHLTVPGVQCCSFRTPAFLVSRITISNNRMKMI
jgi:hypothetical protein